NLRVADHLQGFLGPPVGEVPPDLGKHLILASRSRLDIKGRFWFRGLLAPRSPLVLSHGRSPTVPDESEPLSSRRNPPSRPGRCASPQARLGTRAGRDVEG